MGKVFALVGLPCSTVFACVSELVTLDTGHLLTILTNLCLIASVVSTTVYKIRVTNRNVAALNSKLDDHAATLTHIEGMSEKVEVTASELVDKERAAQARSTA